MASGRHKQSVPAAARLRRLGVPAAAALTVVATITMATASSPDTAPAQEPTPLAGAAPTRPATGDHDVSRSGDRASTPPTAAQRPKAPASTKAVALDLEDQWLTEDLNVWSGPGEQFRLLAVLDTGKLVETTGVVEGPWAQISYDDSLAWVHAEYLADEKPDPPEEEVVETSGGLSSAPCPDGSSVESGLTSNAVTVYRAVCAAFPDVQAWGGLRPGDDGDHGTGHALDIMVYSNSTLGQSIADYVQANASALGVSEILWARHIWSVARASEGWRWLDDRGSATANHYDHVHVSVY